MLTTSIERLWSSRRSPSIDQILITFRSSTSTLFQTSRWKILRYIKGSICEHWAYSLCPKKKLRFNDIFCVDFLRQLFEILSILKPSLGSCEVPHTISVILTSIGYKQTDNRLFIISKNYDNFYLNYYSGVWVRRISSGEPLIWHC